MSLFTCAEKLGVHNICSYNKKKILDKARQYSKKVQLNLRCTVKYTFDYN